LQVWEVNGFTEKQIPTKESKGHKKFRCVLCLQSQLP
jgi:hypothetical protein